MLELKSLSTKLEGDLVPGQPGAVDTSALELNRIIIFENGWLTPVQLALFKQA